MLQADPQTLRYTASRFSAGSQEIRSQSSRLLGRKTELVSNEWKGKASQSFDAQVEHQVTNMRKIADVLENAASVLNRLASQIEHVMELRRQAEQYEMASWEYSGDTPDDLHHRQNLARQAAYHRQQAEMEAKQADSIAAGQFQQIMSMIPNVLSHGGHGVGRYGDLDDLPEPMRSYYERHKELLQDDEGETVETLTMGSYKKTDYENVAEYVSDHASDNESWYEEAWDWLKGEGREYLAISMKNGPTDDLWYNELNHWTLGIPEKVKRVFHTKPFSWDNLGANLDLFISVVPPFKLESGAVEVTKVGTSSIKRTIDTKTVEQAAKSSSEELVDFVAQNHVTNLAWSYEDVLRFSSGNQELAQRMILSTKEIQEGKNLEELVQTFKLTDNPAPKSLSNYQTRIWYLWQESQIASMLDYSQPLEQVARQAFELRNKIRTQARVSMSDQMWSDYLMQNERNITFEELVNLKTNKYGLSGDDLWRDMIRSSMSSRDSVDSLFKLK